VLLYVVIFSVFSLLYTSKIKSNLTAPDLIPFCFFLSAYVRVCRLVVVNSWIYFGFISNQFFFFSLSLFSLRPVTHSVGDLMEQIRSEDRGIDRVVLKTIGKCISHFILLFFLLLFIPVQLRSTWRSSVRHPGPSPVPTGPQTPYQHSLFA
jgi:hypothetical protein